MTTTHSEVTSTRAGAAHVITLTAPDGSAYITWAGMTALVTELRAAEEAGALVLHIRAEGADFCLGRLQGEVVPGVTRHEALTLILEANEALNAFSGVSIAEVHGRVYGFGAGLASLCDLTVADADALVAFNEIDYDLAPLVVSEYLHRYIGPKRAQTMVLTGEEITAATAATWGMVTHVTPAGEAAAEASRIVERLSGFDHGALRLLKRYHRALAAGELVSPQTDAVDRLAEWLAGGRPEHPGW